MKGNDCCGRCFFFIGLSDYAVILEKNDHKVPVNLQPERLDGICMESPAYISKWMETWCGKFNHNNAHFNKDE